MTRPIPAPVAERTAALLAARNMRIDQEWERERVAHGSAMSPEKMLAIRRIMERHHDTLIRLGPGEYGVFAVCVVCGEDIYCGHRFAATTHGPMHVVCADMARVVFREIAPGEGFLAEDLAATADAEKEV